MNRNRNRNISTPRQVKSEQTKRKIFDAAVELIKKHGFQYLTIKNICEFSGVSNGSFYYYFKTKDELLSYYLSEVYKEYVTQLDNPKPQKDYRKSILEAYLFYGEYCEKTGIDFIASYYSTENKALCRRELAHEENAGTEYTSIIAQTVGDLKTAKEKGYLREGIDPRETAADICTIVKGIIFEWSLNEGKLDLKETLERILMVYLDSLSSDKFHKEFKSEK